MQLQVTGGGYVLYREVISEDKFFSAKVMDS